MGSCGSVAPSFRCGFIATASSPTVLSLIPSLQTSPMPLILYQRDNCHLCDQALALLARMRAPDFDTVFIDDDAGLEARYGGRVPVLRCSATEREIDWPFDAQALAALVAEA